MTSSEARRPDGYLMCGLVEFSAVEDDEPELAGAFNAGAATRWIVPVISRHRIDEGRRDAPCVQHQPFPLSQRAASAAPRQVAKILTGTHKFRAQFGNDRRQCRVFFPGLAGFDLPPSPGADLPEGDLAPPAVRKISEERAGRVRCACAECTHLLSRSGNALRPALAGGPASASRSPMGVGNG